MKVEYFDIVIFVQNYVGYECYKILSDKNFGLKTLVVIDESDQGNYNESINQLAGKKLDKLILYKTFKLSVLEFSFDIGFLLWFPRILTKEIINRSKSGIFNIHPSLLPFNRGKFPYSWAIINSNPYGVTIHKIDHSIDGGQILFQSLIETDWIDNGGTLYNKARIEAIRLFSQSVESLLFNDKLTGYNVVKNFPIYYSEDLENISEINMSGLYLAKNLINLIRSRTFFDKGGVFFFDNGKKYFIRIYVDEDNT